MPSFKSHEVLRERASPAAFPRISPFSPIASHEVSLAHSLNSAVDQKCPEGDRVQLQRLPAARAPMSDRTIFRSSRADLSQDGQVHKL